MKRWFIYFLALFFLVRPVMAQEPNNKFGIHLAQPHLEELKNAASLVNSTGGDWGYITLVIQENDQNKAKWQEIFDLLREYHLIPIVRLATKPEGSNWQRPTKEQLTQWANFLESLNWVVKERYVILFNEPNHAAEWGGQVDAADYAQTSLDLAKKLKEKNSDYHLMLAGLDASAPHNPPLYQDEGYFLQQVFETITPKDFEKYFSGWSSHSYPNPGFTGSPWDYGRGTVKTYQWEIELLRELGVNKNLPVFITETGWDGQKLSRETVANYFWTAYENVWLPDVRVQAVTPFVLDYQADPFLGFSWKLLDSPEYYQQYYTVQSLSKTKGQPTQIDKGKIILDLPRQLVAYSGFDLNMRLKNSGQSFWDKKDGYRLVLVSEQKKVFEYIFSDIKNLRPFQETNIDFFIKTNGFLGKNNIKFYLYKNDKKILGSDNWWFEIVPLPSLKYTVGLLPKLISSGDNFEIQVFNDKENLVYKKTGLKASAGKGELTDIQNIIPGKEYRVVILKPYYLPRQEHIVFQKENNQIKFKQMWPFDFNQDGKFTLNDLKTLIKNPKLFLLLFP
jgi:hypothetical protein